MHSNQFDKYSHHYWMAVALEIARKEEAEVPVGAIIVRDNELLVSAVNKIEESNDSTAHAEILAIREASKVTSSWRLNNCTLYTTLEPCAMCMGAIINSRMSKLVFGAYDLNAGACVSAINLIHVLGREKQIEVTGGVLEIETGELLKTFFKSKR